MDRKPQKGLYLSAQQVAEQLGVARITIYRRIADGTLPATRLGRKLLIPASYINQVEESGVWKPQGAQHENP